MEKEIVYNELSKEEKKALYKEYCAQDRLPLITIVTSIIFAISVVIIAISSIITGEFTYIVAMIPSTMIFSVVLPAQIQQRFENWLLKNKNIKYKG